MSAETEVPDSVTHREVQEVLRTFASSGWASMTLEVRGMRVTVGKNGPPAGAVPATAPPAPTYAAPTDPAPTDPAPVAAPPAVTSPRAAAAVPVVPGGPTAAAPPPPDTTGCVEVRSPAVGAFWVAPSPGEPPFVQVGQVVGEHEQLAVVEVMKLMNPVIAPRAGEIVEIRVADAEMVEFDQVLFLIRPADG